MNNDYIKNETQKIFKGPEDYTYKCAMAASWILAHFKATNLKVYKAKDLNPLSDYFIVASVQNRVQAQSAAQAITRVFKETELTQRSLEGTEEGEWILIDLTDIIVHIFQDTSRDIFDIDSLWTHYPQEKIPNEFYHEGSQEPTITDSDPYKDYF